LYIGLQDLVISVTAYCTTYVIIAITVQEILIQQMQISN